jgi:UDP-4-amino-4-deoxy-L-arabinose formyltransferase/UDP-glucuronic acid dehydrogenase (UDP-4-keto-hexauronic acid decarboxylating)
MVCGLGRFGIMAATTAMSLGADVIAVVAPSEGNQVEIDTFAGFAKTQGIPCWVQPPATRVLPFLALVREAAPDLILVWSYSMRLPASLLEIPPLGAINLHNGLLPEYRGRHVVQWALVNGEREIGVTLHYMDEGFDTGAIIARHVVPLGADDDAAAAATKLLDAGVASLREWWSRIADDTVPRILQDETRARYWRRREPEEGRIDWSQPAESICRLIRALTASDPGAFVGAGENTVSIRRARLLPPTPNRATGAVIASGGDGLRIRAGDGDVLVQVAVRRGQMFTGDALKSLSELTLAVES